MKDTLTTQQAVNRLLDDPYAGWTPQGAQALVEHLEELESDTGEEMEFDPVAIRCEYSEHETAVDACADMGAGQKGEDDWPEHSEDDREEYALDFLRDRGIVIEFDGGVIVSRF